jgi:SAM-dependent methyltransferase
VRDEPDLSFKDHFSGHASSYARARPRYPGALFECLAGLCARHELAWDCATGNGQAAGELASRFRRVIASDASEAQITAAAGIDGVEFRVAAAERSGLAAASVDLVTVAQALHWFDLDAFFDEARRVLRPGGVLAYWCYGYCEIGAGCDELVRALYAHVDDYWPPERAMIESGYGDIRPPWPALTLPGFAMEVEWRVEQLLDYVATWSACQRFRAATGRDPVAPFAGRLVARWGAGSRPVRWPLSLTACRSPTNA